jgi:AcrR family transcriptional regulator
VAEPVKTRPYRSRVRAERARQTRRAVLASAQDLFRERGYASTSVADVASRAGVAVDTVYASVGRKPQLLLAVLDMVLAGAEEPVEAEERGYVHDIRAAATAEEKLSTYAAALGDLLPRTAPLLAALREAARTQPGCATVWQQVNDRRAANMLRFAEDLRSTGRVREDLDDRAVADIVWATNAVELYELLTARGWDADRFATFLADLWCRTLLA